MHIEPIPLCRAVEEPSSGPVCGDHDFLAVFSSPTPLDCVCISIIAPKQGHGLSVDELIVEGTSSCMVQRRDDADYVVAFESAGLPLIRTLTDKGSPGHRGIARVHVHHARSAQTGCGHTRCDAVHQQAAESLLAVTATTT